MALGGVIFLTFLARPLQRSLNATGIDILRRARGIALWSGVGLIACELATIGAARRGAGRHGRYRLDQRAVGRVRAGRPHQDARARWSSW
jgi:hypothetical protein